MKKTALAMLLLAAMGFAPMAQAWEPEQRWVIYEAGADLLALTKRRCTERRARRVEQVIWQESERTFGLEGSRAATLTRVDARCFSRKVVRLYFGLRLTEKMLDASPSYDSEPHCMGAGESFARSLQYIMEDTEVLRTDVKCIQWEG